MTTSCATSCCARRAAFALATCRFVAGGALLLAGVMKLRDPSLFMASIDAFELAPRAIVPFLAYAIPWTEITAGLLLIYGLWTRASAIAATLLYLMFTGAIAFAIVTGKDIDCTCFGKLFGASVVGPQSLVRNAILLASALVAAFKGGGAASLDAVCQLDSPPAQERP